MLAANIEDCNDWAPIYGIDMTVIACEVGERAAVVNEIQVSHDTRMFANETRTRSLRSRLGALRAYCSSWWAPCNHLAPRPRLYLAPRLCQR